MSIPEQLAECELYIAEDAVVSNLSGGCIYFSLILHTLVHRKLQQLEEGFHLPQAPFSEFVKRGRLKVESDAAASLRSRVFNSLNLTLHLLAAVSIPTWRIIIFLMS